MEVAAPENLRQRKPLEEPWPTTADLAAEADAGERAKVIYLFAVAGLARWGQTAAIVPTKTHSRAERLKS